MIVQCARCNTEFSSSHPHSHVCPNCHFVFTEDDSQRQSAEKTPEETGGLDIVHSPKIKPTSAGHHLIDEGVARCAFHPDVDAIGHCAVCGRSLCYACAEKKENGLICEPCERGSGPTKLPRPPREEPAEEMEPDLPKKKVLETESVSNILALGPYVEWEYRDQIGGWKAFTQTWRHSLFSPLRFFRRVPIIADYQSPLLYGLYWTLIGFAGGIFWRFLFAGYPVAISFLMREDTTVSLHASERIYTEIFLVLILPLLGLVVLLAVCLLYHVFVVLMTSRHARFQSTVRVICYSAGTSIFFFIPYVGVLVGGIWQLVLVTIGLREMHRTAFPTALAIALIPYTVLLIFSMAFTYWSIYGYDFGVFDLLAVQLMRLL